VARNSTLNDIPRTSCDISRLGSYDQRWLCETFNCQQIAREWFGDAQRIAALNMPEMTGGVNPGDRRALYHLTRFLRPARVLEIGTHIGSSTVALALAAVRNQVDGVETIVETVDVCDVNDELAMPWLQASSPASPRALAAALGVDRLLRFEVGAAVDKLASSADHYDMIFLDGDHSAEAVYREIPLALQRLSSNNRGIVVLHDYSPGLQALWAGQEPLLGPCQAVERFLSEGAGFCVLPLGELPWQTKLGSNMTSLAILSKS
jgi:predicted O-methyltransferase YrrM